MKVQIRLKNLKFYVLVHRFELFKMKENWKNGYKVHDITSSLVALGKEYTRVEKVRKILRALMSDWEKKTTAVEKASDLSAMSLENLI